MSTHGFYAQPSMICRFCAAPLRIRPTGRPPRFCNDNCRIRRWRWDRWYLSDGTSELTGAYLKEPPAPNPLVCPGRLVDELDRRMIG